MSNYPSSAKDIPPAFKDIREYNEYLENIDLDSIKNVLRGKTLVLKELQEISKSSLEPGSRSAVNLTAATAEYALVWDILAMLINRMKKVDDELFEAEQTADRASDKATEASREIVDARKTITGG